MTFPETLIALVQHPGHLAILGTDRVFTMSKSGYLMSLSGPKIDYARVCTQDIVAATWEVMSPEALELRARQNQQGD